MRPRRLLFLNTRLSIGGPAKVTTALAEELARRGDQVLLAGGDPEPGEALDPVAASTALPQRHVPGLRRPVRPLADLLALARVRRLLATERVDVVLTTGSKAGAVGRLAARLVRPRPRTVHVFHGHVFRGHFSDRAGRLFSRVEGGLARITDDLVAVCRSVADDLRELGLHRHARLHTIPVGYDLSPLAALGPSRKELHRELGVGPETLLVLYPARICRVKAQDLMVDAVAAARDGIHPAAAQVLFVGDGEGRDDLEARARALGVADRIRFLGYREDMAPLYRDADLVVLASRSEAIPMSLIEAAAAGRPFLATRVGGIPELHAEGLGRLVPPDDPRALGEALAAMIGPARPGAVPTALRHGVVERFSLARWADAMDEAIGEATR